MNSIIVPSFDPALYVKALSIISQSLVTVSANVCFTQSTTVEAQFKCVAAYSLSVSTSFSVLSSVLTPASSINDAG